MAVFYFQRATNLAIGRAAKDPTEGSFTAEEKTGLQPDRPRCGAVKQSVVKCSLQKMQPLNWDTDILASHIQVVQKNKVTYSRVKAYLANMLIIETVPLAITEGLDAGVVVATCSTPRMNHDREQLKGQQTLRIQRGKSYCSEKTATKFR